MREGHLYNCENLIEGYEGSLRLIQELTGSTNQETSFGSAPSAPHSSSDGFSSAHLANSILPPRSSDWRTKNESSNEAPSAPYSPSDDFPNARPAKKFLSLRSSDCRTKTASSSNAPTSDDKSNMLGWNLKDWLACLSSDDSSTGSDSSAWSDCSTGSDCSPPTKVETARKSKEVKRAEKSALRQQLELALQNARNRAQGKKLSKKFKSELTTARKTVQGTDGLRKKFQTGTETLNALTRIANVDIRDNMSQWSTEETRRGERHLDMPHIVTPDSSKAGKRGEYDRNVSQSHLKNQQLPKLNFDKNYMDYWLNSLSSASVGTEKYTNQTPQSVVPVTKQSPKVERPKRVTESGEPLAKRFILNDDYDKIPPDSRRGLRPEKILGEATNQDAQYFIVKWLV